MDSTYQRSRTQSLKLVTAAGQAQRAASGATASAGHCTVLTIQGENDTPKAGALADCVLAVHAVHHLYNTLGFGDCRSY